ncbi:MAG: alginate export family protein [Fimbriimonadaceae bacterium]|nr:alginate export family protein [Fimbriimonadaceae bacterium]
MFWLVAMPPISVSPQVVWKRTFELRERFERRIDRDFNRDVPDGKSDLFTRARVGVEFEAGDGWSGAFQYQLATDAIWTDARNFSTQNSDANLAFVRRREGGTTVTAGRQKIAFGNERLIGNLEWANVARAYDGVRVTTKMYDLFAARIGVSLPELPDAWVAGAVARWRGGESMLVVKHDEPAGGDVDITTLAHRGSMKGAVDVEYEVALQAGEVGSKDQRGWAVHVGGSRKLDARNRLLAEVNAASGGGDSNTVRTFDNLYPTNHNKYGTSDLQGWKNMNEWSVGFEHQLKPGATVSVTYHQFFLADAADAWYGAGGAPNKRSGGVYLDPSGTSGKDVGSEWNLEASTKLSPSWSVAAGISRFEPGGFIRALNGGHGDAQTWGYLSVQGRF